jgi:arginyl-tRNA--protein-N-Asp/Glu arginylyltransferase
MTTFTHHYHDTIHISGTRNPFWGSNQTHRTGSIGGGGGSPQVYAGFLVRPCSRVTYPAVMTIRSVDEKATPRTNASRLLPRTTTKTEISITASKLSQLPFMSTTKRLSLSPSSLMNRFVTYPYHRHQSGRALFYPTETDGRLGCRTFHSLAEQKRRRGDYADHGKRARITLSKLWDLFAEKVSKIYTIYLPNFSIKFSLIFPMLTVVIPHSQKDRRTTVK